MYRCLARSSARAAPQVFARFAEAERGFAHLLLQDVEALRHLAELVARVRPDRYDVDRRVGSLEIAAAQGSHGLRKLPQGSRGQALGRLADLGRRIGDHARQDEAHADGQQRHDHENIGEHRHELVAPTVLTGHDRGELAEPTFERRRQMIVERLRPIHVAGEHREPAPKRRRARPRPWRWGWRGGRPILSRIDSRS